MDDTKTRPTLARFDVGELRSVADGLATPRARLRVVLNEPEQPDTIDPALVRASYLDAVRRLASSRAQRVLADVVARLDAHALCFDFVVPLLRAVADARLDDRLGSGHEALVQAQLRAALLARHAQAVPEGAPRVVVASPIGHRDELALLLVGLLARHHAFEVVHLGAGLSEAQIRWSIDACRARVLLLGLSQPVRDDERAGLGALLEGLPTSTRAWVSGRMNDDAWPRRMRAFTTLEALDEAFADEAAGLLV